MSNTMDRRYKARWGETNTLTGPVCQFVSKQGESESTTTATSRAKGAQNGMSRAHVGLAKTCFSLATTSVGLIVIHVATPYSRREMYIHIVDMY